MREHQTEIEGKGARLAAIGLGGLAFAKAFREETGIRYPLLIDEDRLTYKAAGLKSANVFHLLRADNRVSRARAKAGGFRQTGVGKDPFQLGGSFVFAPGNVDRFAHVSDTFGDNAPVAKLLAALSGS